MEFVLLEKRHNLLDPFQKGSPLSDDVLQLVVIEVAVLNLQVEFSLEIPQDRDKAHNFVVLVVDTVEDVPDGDDLLSKCFKEALFARRTYFAGQLGEHEVGVVLGQTR